MEHLNLFTSTDRDNLVKARKGESKFGERVQLIPNLNSIYESILDLDVDYVIFGIKEDVGIYANHGKTGASRAWDVVIKFLLNIQNNRFTKANRVLVLGCLEYPHFIDTINKNDVSSKKRILKAREHVEEIDKDVTFLVSTIIRAGKTPIVIGGGHNNSYGTIKGSALALNRRINVVNFDAHSDFRPEEGRHSGNGFSYAYAEGFLKKYFILGLHENYTSEKLFKTINKIKDVQYITYDDIEVRQNVSFGEALEKASQLIVKNSFGIEIDCDAIENIPASAKTPSGFSALQARQYVNYFGVNNNATYLHICEAAPKKKSEFPVGKLITYLITDFIRAKSKA